MADSQEDNFITFHEQYSRYVLESYHEKIRDKLKYNIPREEFPDMLLGGAHVQRSVDLGKRSSEVPKVPPTQPEPPSTSTVGRAPNWNLTRTQSPQETLKVGIIGAGVAGLYAAMILQSLGVQYEIIEAQPSHIGGRLLTHHFGDGPNDYYDVGAMRFPNIYPMWRTFDLFHRLRFTGKYIWDRRDLEKIAKARASKSEDASALYSRCVENVTFGTSRRDTKPEATDVIEYYFSTPKDLFHFNGITASRDEVRKKGAEIFHPAIPQSYVSKGVQYWLDAKIGYFKENLKRNFVSGMEALQAYDYNSMRQFMRAVHPELDEQFTDYMKTHYPKTEYAGELAYPDEVINWIETFSMGTSMYDSAFTEVILDELDFNYAPDVSWKAIQGGAERIALAMAKQLREASTPTGRILQNKRVSKISPTRDRTEFSKGEGTLFGRRRRPKTQMHVHVEGEEDPRVYDHVLSTISLGALRLIDLEDCNLSWRLRESLRSLQYGASVKVGIRFTYRWWEAPGHGHIGGVTTTDRPSRMIVYPSYGIGSKDATMIASYSWSQDALRLGTLAKGQGSLAEQRLVDLVLQDLAKIHDIPFKELKGWLVDAHAYDWYDNEYTVGAFAFFGPAQFRKMYREVTQPAGSMHLHFAGEAASTNHAWVVGALDSSVRALEQLFYQQGRPDLVDKLHEEWTHASEMTKTSLLRQLVLGQDGGKSYKVLYGNDEVATVT